MAHNSIFGMALFFIFLMMLFPATNAGTLQLPQWIQNNRVYISVYLIIMVFIFIWGIVNFFPE